MYYFSITYLFYTNKINMSNATSKTLGRYTYRAILSKIIPSDRRSIIF